MKFIVNKCVLTGIGLG